MNAAAKSSVTERGGRPKSKGKRKLADSGGDHKLPPKQHKTINEHFSSSQDTFDAEEAPQSSLKRSKLKHSPAEPNEHPPKAGSSSLANMYSFPSKPKPNGVNGVIDLTSSSPPTSPQSRMRNKSFGLQNRTVAFAPHQGPKKLVVKNLRTAPRSDPEQYFEKVWGQLDVSLAAIFKNERLPHSREELYKGAENVCRQGKAAETYKRLRERCKTFMSEGMRQELKSKAYGSSDTDMLKAFVSAWTKWTTQLQTIRQIFYFMDQTYLLRSADHPNVTETGLELF